MNISVTIYKEKKEKDFRMIILPSGRSKIGLIQDKDYGIISYLNKKDSKRIGEFIYWALSESDNEEIEDEVVLVGTKKPGDNLGGKPGGKPGNVAPGELNNLPDLQRLSVNSNGLKTLPNTGESQSGMATVAGLVALAVAARLKRKDKQN